MPINIVIPKEINEGELRVALVPQVAEKLIKLGSKIKLQHNAGTNIHLNDASYKNVEIVNEARELYANGDVIIKIQPPTHEEISYMRKGAVLISLLYPHTRPAILNELCAQNITCFAMEMIPRISRAQSMDVLSTQATVIGYKAVLMAADSCDFFFPMVATGAGTMRPAKVLIVGIGVAGLQAIATARRLGARVEAYDVRPETKQEAESLGAKFIDTGVRAIGEGGYARELTSEEKQQQQAVLAKSIAESDIVITTAGVPGKPAPKIINQNMVEMMRAGAIIIDTMAEMGGNCELTKAGETILHRGVKIVGPKNIASSLAVNASEMYAKNVLNFITPMFKDGELKLNWDDEVIAGSAATRDGQVVHPALKKLLQAK